MKTAPLSTFALESIYAKTDRVECLRLIVQNWSVRLRLPIVVTMACVHYEWECAEQIESLPTANSEFLCSDHSIVTNPEDCPLSYYCPAPYHRCQNGLCVLSLSLCPVTATPISVTTTLNSNHPSLQFLEESVNDFITNEFIANGNSACTESAPFLCATGECVTSYSYCPAIRPCSSEYLY